MIEKKRDMGVFERYLTLWVGLCIIAGIVLGAYAPAFATFMDGMNISVNGAPIISIPIAICLFFMMDHGKNRFCRGRKSRQKYQTGITDSDS